MRTWSVRPPGEQRLAEAAASCATAALTYAEVGASLGELPAGYRHGRYERVLGDASVFEPARAALHAWATHVGAGIGLWPEPPPVVEGALVVQHLAVGPLYVIACCRIVHVVDATRRFGFAYGTLPGHPECGEESFMVERSGDRVTLRITAFSRPAHLLARLGRPVAERVQDVVSNRYLDGVEAAVRQSAR